MPKTQFEEKLCILKQEWDRCHKAVGQYDTIIFQIRTWAVTLVSALLGASVTAKRPATLAFLAIFPPLFFWIAELINRELKSQNLRKSLRINNLPRMDSNHDKVIQSHWRPVDVVFARCLPTSCSSISKIME